MTRREFMRMTMWAVIAAAFRTVPSPNPTAAAAPTPLPRTADPGKGVMTLPFGIGGARERVFMPVLNRD